MAFRTCSLADDSLLQSIADDLDLSAVTDGRLGSHLTRPESRGVPLVRTTTRYPTASGRFTAAHNALVEQVRAAAAGVGVDLPERPFNNALVEVYDSRYRKMGFHCDQALDLAQDGFIAIVSCYLSPAGQLWPEAPDLRQLVVKHKQTGERTLIDMPHASVILFSVATNAGHLHKIVLPRVTSQDVRWLGLTLRRARTFVTYAEQGPRFADGRALELAGEEERLAFLQLRGQENRSMDFVYPPVSVTLSEGDLLPPT